MIPLHPEVRRGQALGRDVVNGFAAQANDIEEL
jgi:hypothetical protein